MEAIVAFDEVKAEMAKYKAKNESLVFDYEDAKENAAARSHIFGMRKMKTAITAVHKTTKAEALAACQAIDTEKRTLITAVDDMIEYHAKPIRKIDERVRAEAEAKIKAVEDAKREAEEKRQAELAAKEAELAEREAKVKAAEEAQKAEAEKIRLDAERVERERRIAEEAAAKAKEEAEAKIIADREVKRLEQQDAEAAELKAKREAEAVEKKRIANENHRQQTKTCIITVLTEGLGELFTAEQVVAFIDEGFVPNVTINY